MKRITVDVDDEIHHAFKMHCLGKKETMTDVIVGFIKSKIKKGDDKPKKKK